MEKYLLTVLGSYVDTMIQADEYPAKGDFVHGKIVCTSAGGCPFNVGAVTASKGVKVKGLDMLGKDEDTTQFLLSECDRLGIDREHIYIKEGVTNGKVFIINTGDERTMFIVDPIRPTYVVDEKIQNLLNNATYIYSLLHMINRSFANLEPLLSAKKNGAKVIIDGSSKYDDPSRVKILYSLVDGLFINAVDYARLTDASSKDPKEIIFENGGEFVCITNGSKGSTLYTKDGQYYEPSLKDVEVIDSTGAGDSFAGSFIAGLMMGLPYDKVLKLATASGAYACTVFGGLGGVANLDTLKKFAKEHNYDL